MTQDYFSNRLSVRCSRCGARLLSGMCWHCSDVVGTPGYVLVRWGTIALAETVPFHVRRLHGLRKGDLIANVDDMPAYAVIGGSGCCFPDGAEIYCQNGHVLGGFQGDCFIGPACVVLYSGRVVVGCE